MKVVLKLENKPALFAYFSKIKRVTVVLMDFRAVKILTVCSTVKGLCY